MSPHKRALLLAACLFACFVIATALYARYGYPFALGVYEQQQLGNVERRTGSGKLVEYEDYLRVDPTNLYMRGLLINQLIEFKNPWRALEVAEEGVAAVSLDQLHIAKLLLARALIARGKIDEAEGAYNEVLAALGESGEAHYGLAHIAAVRGNFQEMREIYGTYKQNLGLNSTPDFAQRIKRTYSPLLDSVVTYATGPRFAISCERDGDIDTAFKYVQSLEVHTNVPAFAFFLRGVYEEEQGNRDTALDFYKRAAEAGDALGKFAAERLAPAPPTEEPEAEE